MHIGWAMADVTPDSPVILHGQFHSRISTHVNDPLRATALALESRDAQAIILSIDAVSVPARIISGVRAKLAERLPGLDPECVTASATHTHTAPCVTEGIYPPPPAGAMTPTECAQLLIEGMADAAARAWESRAPGGVSWGYGQAVVGHNRRAHYAGGFSRMYGQTAVPDFECIEGYEDHGVDLLYTWREGPSGTPVPTGVLVNLACPSQETEGALYVSADFWHEVREELWQRHGSDFFVLPQCAAAGDQSPHLLLNKPAEKLMLQRRGLTERQEIGRRIANAVDDVLPLAAADVQQDPPFAHVTRTLDLPVRRVTRAQYEEAAQQYAEHEQREVDPDDLAQVSTRMMMLNRNRRVMDRYMSQDAEPTYAVRVHVLRLGDIAMCTCPFELFLDHGQRIKARSPATQTFVVQLSEVAGPRSAGYLPTARALASRSYGAEVVDGPVGPVGGQVLVDRVLEMIGELWR